MKSSNNLRLINFLKKSLFQIFYLKIEAFTQFIEITVVFGSHL
jgi:hypothetical protein